MRKSNRLKSENMFSTKDIFVWKSDGEQKYIRCQYSKTKIFGSCLCGHFNSYDISPAKIYW